MTIARATTRLVLGAFVGSAAVAPGPLPLSPEPAAAQAVAVTNARVHPVTAPVVEDGTLLVRDGRIVAVGDADDVVVPSDAEVIDARGATLIPGIVESHAHAGFKILWRGATTGSNNNELSRPINAAARAVDGLTAADPAFDVARAAGVTTMNITPGSRSPNSGQATVVKLRHAPTVEAMAFAHGGMKFAMRILRRNEFGLTVREARELIAERLRQARAYMDARAAAGEGDDGASVPPRDLELEAFGRLLSREWPVGVHAHGVEPMRQAIALADSFGLRLYIHHAESTIDLVDELAERDIPISFGPVLPFIGRGDPALAGAVELNRRGGLVAFHQDHPDGPQYYLRQSASLFVREGMPPADALAAITVNPARILGIDDRVGSLDPGKDADFVLLDGPPLDWESHVLRVFVEGREVWRGAEAGDVIAAAGDEGRGTARGVTPDATPGDAGGAARDAAPGAVGDVPDDAARFTFAAPADADRLAITGAEVRTVSGPVLPDATVLVRDGRIEAVGADLTVPDGYTAIDAAGLVLTPGFIDARTSVAIRSGAALDRSRPIRDDFRVRDALGPVEVPAAFGQEARETPVHPWTMNGVTAAYVAASERHVVGGRGAVVKLTDDDRARPVERVPDLAVSIADAPLRTFGGRPDDDNDDDDVASATTRQGLVATLRQWLGERSAAGELRPGDRVRFHAHSPDDILTALRIADEFRLSPIIDGAAGAHVVADRLAAAGASVVVGPAMMGLGGGGPREMEAHSPYNPARLRSAGVPVALATDAASGRSVAVEVANARAHGLEPEAALRAVTLDAARIVGVDDRLGSIEPGKDADLVLWSGDPVGTWAEARLVMVDGRVVFDR